MLSPAEPELNEDLLGRPQPKVLRPAVLKALDAVTSEQKRGIPFSLSFLRDPGSLLAMAVMGFIFYNQIIKRGFPPSLPNTFAAALVGSAILLFAIRREPTKKGNAFDAALAIVGTFCMAFLPVAHSHHFSITLLQSAGSGLWLWSLLCLGRSFGLAPADRGLKTSGPYRFIRHPMYAGELVDAFGAVIAIGNAQGTLIFAIWWLFQMLRIMREEQIISGYDDYSKRVRWRILPGVW